ncbi:MAG: MFS transporter [Polyangiaceae bacterium]|nr:MFS transporter [Polyangiaceae bacterium]
MATTTVDESPSAPTPLAPSLFLLIAAGAGLSAASLYYNQPILGTIARDFGVAPSAVGWLPTFTQVGYAVGIFLFAPLGDRLDLRRVIIVKGAILATALLLAGFAPSVGALSAASLAIGLAATTAQDFVPAAAALAPAGTRGKTVGIAMTGLLLGILLSRVASGIVGEHLGWRAVYMGSSVLVAGLVAVTAIRMPSLPPSATSSYGALLRSTLALVRDKAPLRRAALGQALLAMAFSGFWSTLAIVLANEPFRMGSSVAGAFGLAGAVGALAAPVAGSLADKRGPAAVLRVGAALVFGAFLALVVAPGSFVVLLVAVVVFDLGVHASLIAHQSIVYGLDATARSRLNAVLVSSMFVGMAIGSAIAARLVERWGLAGVGGLGVVAAVAAWMVRVRSSS